MRSYRLSEEAEADLIRIHQYGSRVYGEQQTDQYFYAFFDRFEELAKFLRGLVPQSSALLCKMATDAFAKLLISIESRFYCAF